MNRKNKDGEDRQVARPAEGCTHPNKYQYNTNDERTHWICPDCSTTDLG